MLTRRDFSKLLSTWAAALGSGGALTAGKPSPPPPSPEAQAPAPVTNSQANTTDAPALDMDPWRTRTLTSVEEADKLEVWERTLNLGLKYDLLIKGGTVIDPDQRLHAVLDVAVKNGKISQIARDIPPDP